jgi:hypothetical protein
MNTAKLKTAALVVVILAVLAGLALLVPKIFHAVRQARAPRIVGAWEGSVQANEIQLRVVLKIARSNGVYSATADSIDQRVADIPVSKLVYDYPSLVAEFQGLGGNYVAKLDSLGKEMSGTFKTPNGSLPLVLKFTTNPDKIGEAMAESDYKGGTGPQGAWQGTLQAGGMALRLNFKIGTNADGTYRAEMDSVDQGVTGMPASSVSFDAPAVKVEFKQIRGTFQADLSADNSQFKGTWTQMGKTFPLTVDRAKADAAQPAESEKNYAYTSKSDFQGHWQGTLAIKQMKLRLVFNVARLPDATYAATMDSLDQGARSIPATTVDYTAPKAHLEWAGIGATFDGQIQNGKLNGTFTQGGQKIPLVLQRDAAR